MSPLRIETKKARSRPLRGDRRLGRSLTHDRDLELRLRGLGLVVLRAASVAARVVPRHPPDEQRAVPGQNLPLVDREVFA